MQKCLDLWVLKHFFRLLADDEPIMQIIIPFPAGKYCIADSCIGDVMNKITTEDAT